MLEELRRHNALVQERIMKSFGYADTEDFIQKGEDDDLEKAHQDGDIHPKHPDWVWVSSASGGKGDWRKLNGRIHKKHSDTQASNKKQENNNKTNHPQGGTKSNQSVWEKLSDNVAVELGKQIVRQNLQRETAVKNWVSSVLKTAADEGVIEAKKSTQDKKKSSTTSTTTSADKRGKKIIANQVKVDKVFNQMSKFLKTKKIDGFELWADKDNWNEFYNKFDDKLRKLGFSIGRNYKKSFYWNIYSKDSDFNDSVASVSTDNDLSSLRKKIKDLMEGASTTNATAGKITLKITTNGSGVVKLSNSVNAKWEDVKDEDFGGRIIGVKIDGELGAKTFPYSFDYMKRKKYDLYTFEEAKAEAEKYLNNKKSELTQKHNI